MRMKASATLWPPFVWTGSLKELLTTSTLIPGSKRIPFVFTLDFTVILNKGIINKNNCLYSLLRRVSNKYRYILKKAWESYIFTHPDAQTLSCFPVKIEKYAETYAYMATSHALQSSTGKLSPYAVIYSGFSWLGGICKIRTSIKALVNAYSNIYVHQLFCHADSLIDDANLHKILLLLV